MGLAALISTAPGLMAQLTSLGLDTHTVFETGGEMTRQIMKRSEAKDVADLLACLDVQGFIDRLDVTELTARVNIDVAQARSFIYVIAPFVQAYGGEARAADAAAELLPN